MPATGAEETAIGAETVLQVRRPGGGSEPAPERIGRYVVRALLGEGSMGRVWRAVDPETGREVAIKTLKEAFARDATAMKRFCREAEAVGRFDHPGLVSVLDVGEDFIVLELVEGESLAARLARQGALPPPVAIPILAGVAEALDHIHARGVVHRDVKPSNVIVGPGGAVKLTDFGIAHLTWAPMTRTGELIGSPAYMAPEQIVLGEVEPASDIYALGVVAYEVLTGRRALGEGKGLGELLLKIAFGPAPSVREARPDLPAVVDAVLAKALAKDPAERFPSARMLVATLAVALRDPAGPAPPAATSGNP